MAHEHRSGLPAAYDRGEAAPETRAAVIWPAGVMIQGADLNEAQTLGRRRTQRVANMVARDGDRISGGEILVDVDAATVDLTAGRVYVAGDARPIAARQLTGVPMTGDVEIGVRLVRAVLTSDDDTSLLGLHPGSDAEGETGPAREIETISWARQGDGGMGDFYAVYLLLDGVVIDQAPPPTLSPINQQIAIYDYDVNGHYIVDGCEVAALGKIGSDQVFSIAAGTANILGYKRIRAFALRLASEEDPDLETISAEVSTYTAADGAANVATVQRPPIAGVTQAVVTKRETVNVIRGLDDGGADELPRASVVAIESVTQGGIAFVATTDYVRDGDSVSWAPGGAEPIASSSYTVTYTYNEAVTPSAISATQVTVSGGINGGTVLLSYTSKIPRVDLVCLNQAGLPVYVKGVSARQGALAPATPSELLKLAEVVNDWFGTPTVVNNGTRNFTQDDQRRLFRRLLDVLGQFDRAEAERDILARQPVAKKGIFTDTFVDDFYRDPGAAQSASTNRGVLMLDISPILQVTLDNEIVTMPWSEEILVRQEQDTSSIKIQPYMSFTPMPGSMKLEPAVDFFARDQVEFTSGVTREMVGAPGTPPGVSQILEVASVTLETGPFMRPNIPIAFTIDGFGVGETLQSVTFAGIDVTPGWPLAGDASGRLVASFAVPVGVPAGRARVVATGAAGSHAEAVYVADRQWRNSTTLRAVTLVSRPPPPPPAVAQWLDAGGGIGGGSTPAPEQNRASDNAGASDPLAQSFWLPASRHVVGIDFKIKVIGDASLPIRVQLRPIENGYPAAYEVMAEAMVSLADVFAGDWLEARFDAPVFLSSSREYAFCILSDDLNHAVAISRLGDVIDLGGGVQARVSRQPYIVGTLFTSSNSFAWTAEQDADMAFRVVGARFTQTARTVTLWTGDFDEISDLVIRGVAEQPTAAATFRYELVRANGQVIPLTPGQELHFSEFVTETVTIRAVLAGTETIAPVLYPGTAILAGRLATTGTYVTRAFPMGNPADVTALFKALLPAGSSVTVEIDKANGSWEAMTLGATGVIGNGWTEPEYTKSAFSTSTGRIRLTLTGTPAARPSLAQLRAFSI